MIGARLALSCVGHELASPLMALYAYLKVASAGRDDPALGSMRACADRIRAIADVARQLARLEDADGGGETALGPVITRAVAALGAPVAIEVAADAGDARVRLGAEAAALIVAAALRAVHRAALDPARLRVRLERVDGASPGLVVRVDGGAAAPATWADVDPFGPAATGLDLWSAAAVTRQAGGAVRIGEHEGEIAVELDLPAAEAP